MEKLKRIPKNFIRNIELEAVMVPPYVGSFPPKYGKYEENISVCHRAKMELVIDFQNNEDSLFIEGLKQHGLEFILMNSEFNINKFRFVINEGMQRLPILLKHPDPDIAKLAWILSKYFSQRNDIMPEQVLE